MKKTLCLLIGLLLCFLGAARAQEPRVLDEADLFTPAQEAELSAQIADFQAETGMDFVIWTSEAAHAQSLQQMADNRYDQGGYGLDAQGSGILYLIDMYERTPYLSTTGAMIDIMTDERIEAAHDASYELLASGRYGDAAGQMIRSVAAYCQAGVPEGQYRYDEVTGRRLTGYHRSLTASELLVCALIGLVVSLLFVKAVQGRYQLKGSLYHYAFRENSHVELTDSQDEYLHSTVTRRRKPEPVPPSGGSFGGRAGGSGVHRSSGGRTHGGGAGKRF